MTVSQREAQLAKQTDHNALMWLVAIRRLNCSDISPAGRYSRTHSFREGARSLGEEWPVDKDTLILQNNQEVFQMQSHVATSHLLYGFIVFVRARLLLWRQWSVWARLYEYSHMRRSPCRFIPARARYRPCHWIWIESKIFSIFD